MAEPTVSAGYARGLLDLAVAKGADRATLMARAGLEAAVLADPDNRVPFTVFKALMREGQTLSGEPALALYFGALAFEEMSIVGLICHAAETMTQAFTQMNRYGRLVIEVEGVSSGPRFKIVRRDGETWVEDTRANPNDFPELTESTLARFVTDFSRTFGDAPFVKLAHVTHAEPAHSAAYRDILNAPVVFSSGWNAMQIDTSWLTITLTTPNRYVFGIFSDHAAALLKQLEQSKSTRGAVESLLIPILHTGDITMQQVATQMGVSRSTLHRRLKAEGVRYETLFDELRHTMALHYLSGKKLSVSQTAYLVGFSEPSAFSRAFKRWTGASPRQRKPD